MLVAGGRVGISDVVAEDHLTPLERAERGSYVGCIAGALSTSEYLTGLADAGFVDAGVEFTHEAAPGLHGAIIRATKPASTASGDGDAPSCCSSGAQATCCAPEAKSGCCGSNPAPGSCGGR